MRPSLAWTIERNPQNTLSVVKRLGTTALVIFMEVFWSD
jgi:hypothetical protein